MPRFDGTGPCGMGPRTGRGMGHCGRGLGMGFHGRHHGYGRGLGRYFGGNNPQTKEEKVEDAKAYKKALQEEIEDIDKELSDLQKQE